MFLTPSTPFLQTLSSSPLISFDWVRFQLLCAVSTFSRTSGAATSRRIYDFNIAISQCSLTQRHSEGLHFNLSPLWASEWFDSSCRLISTSLNTVEVAYRRASKEAWAFSFQSEHDDLQLRGKRGNKRVILFCSPIAWIFSVRTMMHISQRLNILVLHQLVYSTTYIVHLHM